MTHPLFRPSMDVDSGIGRISQAGELFKPQAGATMVNWRRFGRYALVYLTEGQGGYEDAAGRRCSLEAGDLILVFPDLPHRYGPGEGQAWREVYLVFEGPIFDAWAAAGVLDSTQPIRRITPIDPWQRRIIRILEPTSPPTPRSALIEVCRLQQLLADIFAMDEPNPHDAWLVQARALLTEDLPLPAIARRLHCSYATFRRRFTRLAGITPLRHRAMATIQRACELMHAGAMTDKQIANELGFCDEFHFSRRFRQITSLSPRAYRRALP